MAGTTFPVLCMDCRKETGRSEVEGSHTICDGCTAKRYGPEEE